MVIGVVLVIIGLRVEGRKMDTTGFMKGQGWAPSQSHAGPIGANPFDVQNSILTGIANDLGSGESFDVGSGETVNGDDGVKC